MMSDILRPEILDQPKRDLGISLATWLRDYLEAFGAEILLSQDVRRSGFMNTNAIEGMLIQHNNGTTKLGLQTFSLFTFEPWRHQVMA